MSFDRVRTLLAKQGGFPFLSMTSDSSVLLWILDLRHEGTQGRAD